MIVAHGLGRRDGARDGGLARRPRREGRRPQGPALSARSPSRDFVAALPRDGARDRRARPHQGAGRGRRAALPGRRRRRSREARRRRSLAARRASSAAATGCRPRSSRPAMVKAVFDELAQDRPPQPLHRRHRRRRDPHCRCPVDDALDIEPDDVVRAVFFGLGRRRHGRREQELDQDHRRGDGQLRAGLLRLRLEEVGRDHRSRTCASARGRSARRTWSRQANFVACHQFEFLERYDVLEHRRAGRRRSCSNAPLRPGRGLGRAAARGAGADPREAAPVLRRSTPIAVARDAGMGGPHQHDHADLLLRDLRRAAARGGDRADQEGDREDLRQEGRRGRAAQLRRGRSRRSPHLARGAGARRGRRRRAAGRRSCRDEAPGLRAARHGGDARRQGRPAAGVAPSRWTAPGRSGTARWEKRNIAAEIPVWDPAICIQCNKCALVCPHAAIRAKVYRARRTSPARPRRSSPTDLQGRRLQGLEVHDPGGAGGLHRLHALRRWSARPRTRRNPKHKAINMAPQRAAARAGAGELRLLPRPARARPRDASRASTSRARSSSSRCSSTPAPAPAAARRRTSSC